MSDEGHSRRSLRGRQIAYALQQSREVEAERAWREREPLLKEAVYAAIRQREYFEKRLALGLGLSMDAWPEAAPLTGQERTAVIAQLREMWKIR